MEPCPRALQKDPDITLPYSEACNLGQMVWQTLCLLGTFPGAGRFCPGIALVVCYSPFQDLPQDNLRDKKTIPMSLVYIPEHWILPSFMEAAYVVNHAWDAKDIRGMMSLAQIHKRSPFYPVYHDKGTPPEKGGGSSYTVTKLPSSLEPKGQRPLSLPHFP